MKSFINELEEYSDPLQNWNENIWRLLVESAIVHIDKTITFVLKDGTKVEV